MRAGYFRKVTCTERRDMESQQHSTIPTPLDVALRDEIDRCMGWSSKYRKVWSFVTHAASTVVIVGSAAATFLQFFQYDRRVAGAVMLAVTAFAAAQTGFRQKWATYRLAHAEFRFLQIDLCSGARPASKIRGALKRVCKQHDLAVLMASAAFLAPEQPAEGK